MNDSIAENYPQVSWFLGLPIHRVSVEELHAYCGKVIRAGQKALVLNYNIHAVNLAFRESWMKDFFRQAQLVFCDGDGVRWGLKLLGIEPPPKITYASWIWQLADFCAENGFSLYFLGAKPGVAEQASRRLVEKFPSLKIAGIHHGYFPQEGSENLRIIADINRCKPDILVLGLGMPAQEKWLSRYWRQVDARIFLTGGAVFDYTSGKLKRAPDWMIRLHLEWLFRLFQEPRRLFQRYVIGNPVFFARILKEKLIKK